MNRFQFAALALILGVLCSAGVPLAAQPADPMDIDIAPPPGAGGTREGTGDQFDFENSATRESPRAPQDAGPGFDGLETRERPELPVEMDSQPRRESASTADSSNPLVRQIEEELIRIDLDLRELEADIRMYRGLQQSSRNGADAQALERTLFDYEAQRRGLIAQKRKLTEARQKAGASGPGSPDPSFAARTFEEEQENRLREGFDGNPLSPESHVANAARDAARTRDVVRDNEIQKFIEGIKDEELKERVAELNEAARMDPTLTKPFEDLLAAIAKVGAGKAKPADVADALKRMEDEAKRKGLEST
ncbi:MAG: hypothetical protein HY816_13605, partial [Candidatus Wallbacteria bacterium]|nr:hypothetical protein [Candidatus Wallbacteria bacterium]